MDLLRTSLVKHCQARPGSLSSSSLQDQYRFVYDVLEEAYICGKTWFPASELAQQIKQKSHKNVLLQQNEYQLEYKVMQVLVELHDLI